MELVLKRNEKLLQKQWSAEQENSLQFTIYSKIVNAFIKINIFLFYIDSFSTVVL